MMGSLQRVEQKTVSSQNLASAIENMHRIRIDARGNRLRLKVGERPYPKSWSGSTPLGGFAREIAVWLGYVDSKHEAGKLIQQITKGTPRASEAWTDSRHAVDDKYVELDYELAVAPANVTEGAARSTVLKVTPVEPSLGSWHGERWLMVMRPCHRRTKLFCATAHTCDIQKMQVREEVEGEDHGMVIANG